MSLGVAAEHFYRVLITQIVAPFHSVESMPFCGVVLAERRIDSALGGHRVGAGGVDLGYQCYVCAAARSLEGRPHPCHSATEHDDVVY